MTIGDFLFFVLIIALFFLFHGDPTVWDALQNSAKGLCK
jgi:hypothetical protein